MVLKGRPIAQASDASKATTMQETTGQFSSINICGEEIASVKELLSQEAVATTQD